MENPRSAGVLGGQSVAASRRRRAEPVVVGEHRRVLDVELSYERVARAAQKGYGTPEFGVGAVLRGAFRAGSGRVVGRHSDACRRVFLAGHMGGCPMARTRVCGILRTVLRSPLRAVLRRAFRAVLRNEGVRGFSVEQKGVRTRRRARDGARGRQPPELS